MPETLGFLNVDKPLGLTSHDVVAHIRRVIRPTRVGHAGTLDPMAIGVLVLCIGQATRLSEYVMRSTKQYAARICLGVETDTYDSEGKVLSRVDIGTVDLPDIERILSGFIGQIQQAPPMHSAIKVGGRRLYELARKGVSIERASRTVVIETIQVIGWEPPFLTVAVTCGPGTYIRSLAHDVGSALGVGAHLAALVRLRSGHFLLKDAVALADINHERLPDFLVSPRLAFSNWPAIRLDYDEANAVRMGRSVRCPEMDSFMSVMAYDDQDRLVAVGDQSDGLFRPTKVFSAASSLTTDR